MRIAYIYTAILEYGGVDRILTQKTNYLADKMGYEVYIITDSQRDKPTSFPLSNRVKLIDLDIDFSQEYKYGIVKRFFVYKKLMRLYRKKLTTTLIDIHADIVCTVCGRDMDFITKVYDGSKKIGESHIAKEYIRNFHLLSQRGFPYNIIAYIWRKKFERAVKNLDAFVVLTNRDAKDWSNIKQCEVIPNFVAIYPKITSSCKNKKVINVGRLSQQKSQEYLIKAWKPINDKYPEWELNIYGEGELYEYLTSLIKDLGLNRSIHIYPNTRDIEEKYIDSSIFVLSSTFEGFPLVLLEAMRCGLPCISFDCPNGPKEIIKNGYNGILVENKNLEKLSSAIEELITDDKKKVGMGQYALNSMDFYSQDSIMQKWNNLFKRIAQQ